MWNPCTNCQNASHKRICKDFCSLHKRAQEINREKAVSNGIYQQRQEHYQKYLKEGR